MEYKKSFVKPTTKDKGDGTETSEAKKTTMPDDDKPPRDLAPKDMGNLAKKNCKDPEAPVAEEPDKKALSQANKGSKVWVTKNDEGKWVVQICSKGQRGPKRKNKKGKEVGGGEDMKAKREKIKAKIKELKDSLKGDAEGAKGKKDKMKEFKGALKDKLKEKFGGRKKDKDGWDGTTFDKAKTDWGTTETDAEFAFDEENMPEYGLGLPSKGVYSAELGGYKTFGTDGQGEDTAGLREEGDSTCGERVMLVTITATEDTSSAAAEEGGAGGRLLQEAESELTMSIGNYQFADDAAATALEAELAPEEADAEATDGETSAASFLNTALAFFSIASLFAMSS